MASEPKWPRTQSTWAASFRLAHEQDGRDWGEQRRVLEWSQRDDFWAPNIMSASKFRKQYEQLRAKMRQPSSGGKGGESHQWLLDLANGGDDE